MSHAIPPNDDGTVDGHRGDRGDADLERTLICAPAKLSSPRPALPPAASNPVAHMAALKRLKVEQDYETLVAGRKRELTDAESRGEKLTDASEREAWKKQMDVIRSTVANDELVIGGERAGAVKNGALLRFFHELEEKYRRAASHPWQPVSADLPFPQ